MKSNFEDKFDHIIKEPLLTEEGFLNEAAINELETVILNTPKTHERFTDDKEWATKYWTDYREILGYLAHWAIRNISESYVDKKSLTYQYDIKPPWFPPELEKVIAYLGTCVRPKFDKDGFANLTLCEISKMLYDVLYDQNISIFDDWNTEETMGKFWLDLDALLHNVCISIRGEKRERDRFDKKFEEEWAKNPDNPKNSNSLQD